METPTSQNDISPLLRIPLEINRQIRDEAWDYMARGNLWIRVTTDFHDDSGWTPLVRMLHYQIPNKYSKRLDNEVAVHFRLDVGNRRVPDDGFSFTFAYHPLAYGAFVQDISQFGVNDLNLTVEVNPTMIKRPSVFSKTIEPLSPTRGLRNVSFTGMDD
ncbi:hypothetical protein PG997_013476 [Apiospora hydei]|uniref:Uncharacterized protein n=1 Tax=Apiospora hydei TaxID=1337664 RepID=A0ABR1V6A5_9PEZI